MDTEENRISDDSNIEDRKTEDSKKQDNKEDNIKENNKKEDNKKEDNNRQGKRQKRRRQIRRRILGAVCLLFLLAGGIAAYVRFAPETKRMSAQEYFDFMISREAGEDRTLEEGELAVVLQDQVAVSTAKQIDDALYLDYTMAREYLNDRFFLDEESGDLIYTDAYSTYEIPKNSDTYMVDGEEKTYDRQIFLNDEEGMYLSADFLALYTNVEYTVLPKEKHVLIRYQWGQQNTADVKKTSAVRFKPDIKGLVLTKVEAGETVTILEQMEKWSRVVTENGYIGYISNKRITEPELREVTREFAQQEYPDLCSDEPINLVWHQIGVEESNDYLEQDTADMTGVNVISPTWFSLSDNEGNFTSLASETYVQKAHEMGLQVWGLVSNFSPDMSTTTLVASTSARRNLVKNLIAAAQECGMDGINVDLEAIASEAGYGYVQFVRELSIECRKNKLVLSVDMPMPFDFNSYYNWKEIGTVADYVILMGYDEHYAGSEAGSVASLSFEEDGIKKTLENYGVEARKIISGIPFYTRMWYSEEGELWSEVLGMTAVANTLENYGVETVWDDTLAQNYAEWTLDNGILCRIWVEDEASIACKAGLVKTYELGGVAAWALGDERASIWEVISNAIA